MTKTDYPARQCAIILGNKSQALELRPVQSDGYLEGDDDSAVELVEDLLKAKLPVSQWAIWDNRTDAPAKRQDKPYSAVQFKAIVANQEFALVWCKRGAFRAPVLKVGVIDSKANNTGKRSAPQRFGRGA
jgi:hypothetical protein